MFNLNKNQKTVFSKLYRYYCGKLLTKIWLALFYLLLFGFMIIIQGFSYQKTFDQKLINNVSWQWRLFIFWLISFLQLGALWMMMTPLISYLVGRGLGWKEMRKRQLFQMPKISREEDIKVLIFTPKVERETVILAKFAAAFTYFMAFNFFLTLLFFIFFLFTNLGIIAAFSFLLLNGIGLALVNFILIVPFLFYQTERGSFLVYFILLGFIMSLYLLGYFFGEFILQYPLVFCLLWIPFSVLVGYLFFSLYRKMFLKNDLD